MRYQRLGRSVVLLVPLVGLLLGVVFTTSDRAASRPVSAPVTFTSEPPALRRRGDRERGHLYFPMVADKEVFGSASPVAVDEAIFTMAPGDIRRVTDQLEIRAHYTGSDPEVDDSLECFDVRGHEIFPPGAGSDPDADAGIGGNGTNYISQHDVPYQWNASMLIQAPRHSPSKTYFCLLAARIDTGHQMTVMAPTTGETKYGTWLEVSSTDVRAREVPTAYCASGGLETPPSYCVYVGGPTLLGNPASVYVPWEVPEGSGPDGTGDFWGWTAREDATTIDGVATLQISDCYGPSGYIPIYGFLHKGTPNCLPKEWGASGVDNAAGESSLEIDQLYPHGAVCQVHRAYSEETTPDGQVLLNEGFLSESFAALKAQEHLPLYYHVSVPVSQTCDGSRRFALDVHIQWTGGNDVVINGGRLNVLDSALATTTTVPDVARLTATQADHAIQAAGLTAVTTYVHEPGLAGTVVNQNSPGGTVEPVGSQVEITVTLGTFAQADPRDRFDQ